MRILILYPTCGTPDIVGRPIAAAMSLYLGQPGGVVENNACGGDVHAIQGMEIPPVNESAGIAGCSIETGFGLVACPGTPRPVIDRLARVLAGWRLPGRAQTNRVQPALHEPGRIRGQDPRRSGDVRRDRVRAASA